jgi:catechol 2,3-dioxygenase-like lactoylglutathione lyase family enzyme
VKLPDVLHFGLWERAHAARATGVGPERIPLGLTVGFEVDGAGAALGAHGVRLLQPPHDEPWGQRTARFLSPSGMLCEFSETPWARSLEGTPTS